jgi:hypothetical protein
VSEPAGRDREPARSDSEPSIGSRPGVAGPAVQPRVPRPWIERIGLAGIALVFASLFGALALGSWSGGELFLAVMGGIGCFMTLWVGALTLLRG